MNKTPDTTVTTGQSQQENKKDSNVDNMLDSLLYRANKLYCNNDIMDDNCLNDFNNNGAGGGGNNNRLGAMPGLFNHPSHSVTYTGGEEDSDTDRDESIGIAVTRTSTLTEREESITAGAGPGVGAGATAETVANASQNTDLAAYTNAPIAISNNSHNNKEKEGKIHKFASKLLTNFGKELSKACFDNNISKVPEIVLSKQATFNIDINYYFKNRTPLIWSCYHNNYELVCLLLNKLTYTHSDINQVSQYGESGLSLCVTHSIRHFNLFELLLNKGGNVDMTGNRGWTPLFWAARHFSCDKISYTSPELIINANDLRTVDTVSELQVCSLILGKMVEDIDDNDIVSNILYKAMDMQLNIIKLMLQHYFVQDY